METITTMIYIRSIVQMKVKLSYSDFVKLMSAQEQQEFLFGAEKVISSDRNHHISDDSIVLRLKESAGGDFKQYIYTLNGTSFTKGEETTASTTTDTEGTTTYWYSSSNGYEFYGARGSGAQISENANKNVNFGSTSISQKGIAVGGSNLIKRSSDGTVHIGENSWITKEENGRQKVWAKDANGNSIPIDYTNGTKLLINGRDVEQAIDNVGALSAALTGLPTIAQDAPLSCGAGLGTHNNSNAISGGCASKYSERLDLNVAAAYIPKSQEYQGDNNAWSGRAGFVYKFGKISKPTLISMK